MYHGLAALMTRALRLDARLLRGHLFRLAFVVLVYFSLLIAQLQALSFGAPGLRFFTNLVWLNACFICLAGVSFFATAITEEKEEDTLGLLRMAGLNPLGILLGKSTSRLLQAALLLVIQFPFTLLAVTLGGVLTIQVVAMYVALLSFIVLLANVALVFSVMCQKGGNAAGLTALWLLLYIAAWPLAEASLAWFTANGITKTGFGNTLLIGSVEIIRKSCVFERIGVILSTGFDEPVFSTQVMTNMIGGLACFGLSWALFNAFAKNATPTAQTRGLLGRSKSKQRTQIFSPGRVWDPSLAWKDYNFIAGGTALGVIKLVGYFSVFGLVVLFNTPPFTYNTNWRDITAGSLMLWCLLSGLDLSLMSSRLFYDELKGQTMSALLMLPRSVAYVGYSKLIGCLLGLWPAATALVVAFFALPHAAEFCVDAADEPSFWAAMMTVLVFAHVVALLSLFVKWGALPLAILLMMVSVNCCPVLALPFLLLSSTANSDGAAFAATVTLWILTGVICFVLQVMIGARLQEIGSK